MEGLIASLILLLVGVFCFLFSILKELQKVKSLRKLVAWCVTGGDGIALWEEISNAQNKLKIKKKYCLFGDEEWEYVREILDEYKKDLMLSYFRGHLIVIKSKYVLSGENYFMASLYTFLSDHQCDYKFLEHDMHKEIISYKSYGESFSAGFDATYALTEFAMVFHKMHYITYMYCKGNEILKAFVPEWNEKNLKEILDTKQIQLSRF